MKIVQNSIYLDQAATSWPKPDVVGTAMLDALNVAGSPSRSAHAGARKAERLLSCARKSAARFFEVGKPDNLIFVPGATSGLNMVLRGLRETAKLSNCGVFHVAYSGSEHNAVTRTLAECARDPLSNQGEAAKRLIEIRLDSEGFICLSHAEEILHTTPLDAFACQHGSNVTAVIQPIERLAQLCLAHDVPLIVDGSQTGGHMPISLDKLARLGVSAWICSGHKGLLGPAGSGLVYLAEGFYPQPQITGGTGSGDHFIDYSAPVRPADYEAGTPALPTIAGLGAATDYLHEHFDENLKQVDTLTRYLLAGLEKLEGIEILGPTYTSNRLPLVSIIADDKASEELAFLLEAHYQIAARAGLHCAPLAHRHAGTYPDGALRFSWNASNTIEELDTALDALQKLI